MRWNSFNLVGPAIDNTKKLLFPYNFKYWGKLTFVSILSKYGVSSSGSGGGGNGSSFASNDETKSITGNAIAGATNNFNYGLIGLLVALFSIIGLVMTYITSIFTFIYIEALVKKRYSISESWNGNKKQGHSFFGFRIIFGLISLAVFAAIFAYPVLKIMKIGFINYFQSSNFLSIFLDLWPFLLLFIIWAIIVGIFTTFVYDFSLAEMYHKGIGIQAGIKNTFRNLRRQKAEGFVYLIAKIVMGICVAIVSAIVAIPIVILALLIGLIVYFSIDLISKVLAITLIVILGIIAIIFLVIILLPARVFMGYFALRAYEKAYSVKILR